MEYIINKYQGWDIKKRIDCDLHDKTLQLQLVSWPKMTGLNPLKRDQLKNTMESSSSPIIF